MKLQASPLHSEMMNTGSLLPPGGEEEKGGGGRRRRIKKKRKEESEMEGIKMWETNRRPGRIRP